MSAASLDVYRLSSNRRQKRKTLQCTGALADLDYSTQEAKYINLATVEESFSRHGSISEEVCCIIRARKCPRWIYLTSEERSIYNTESN